MECCWAPPCLVTVPQLRVGPGWTEVARLKANGLLHSADAHIQTNGTTLDGAIVRLYAVVGNIESLVGTATVGTATLETSTDAAANVVARRGLIVGATNVLAESFAVRIYSASLVASGGRLTLTGWGQ